MNARCSMAPRGERSNWMENTSRSQRAVRWLMATAVALVCVAAAEFATAADAPKQLDAIQLNDGDSIVFLGDSITHQCLYTQYVEDFFYTRHPDRRIRFHNAGVGGAKAWDALQRFENDVAAYKPKYVTVLLGMNDGSYQPFNQSIFDTYQADMAEVVERISACGAVPVLMTPTMYDALAARMSDRPRPPETVELYNSVLAYYGSWLRDVAQRNGYGFVDMYGPLNQLTAFERKSNPSFTMIADAVHPGPDGQLVMAYALLDDLGQRAPLSSIRIDLGADGPAAKSTGGQVTDIEAIDDGLAFTWTADALPFVVPEEAAKGAELLHLGHRMSREALEIHTLPPGRYELSIDGQSAGLFDSAALARHIELQGNDKTPQYQQAAKVAELNKQRNAGPVRSMRSEWSKFQQFARLKKQLESMPDNEDLKKQLAESTKNIDGMEERVRQHEAAAREIEDQIFLVNQPVARRFTIRRAVQAGAAARRGDAAPIVPPDSKLELLFTRSAKISGGLTEGPAVAPDGSIYFSDIPIGEDKGMILRFDTKTKETSVFSDDSRKSNGLIFNAEGKLVACEGANFGGRAVSIWDVKSGERTVLAEGIGGKRFNAPNDLCLDDKGRIYFTDPRYLGDEPRELEHRAVYRVDRDGKVEEITHEISKPNGIAISPNGKTLYVADHDNGTDKIDPTQPPPPAGDMKIYAYPLGDDGRVNGPRRTLVDFGDKKGCDGMCVDSRGNLYLTARDPGRPGVMVVNPRGEEVAFIATGPENQSADNPEKPPIGLPSNVEFGIGDESNVLYVTVDLSLYRIRLNAKGHHVQYK